ncbi:cyclic nucleotide-binding protein [Mangrovimonas yunxiaonensis]|uniref:Cyclic nucleotide-binding protein n=1 Tax=Mangrovimonas yunxiaonensis TaxID=1197477 RepID=A0A084THG9_9FLAO|nr:Crp/Fnr family transcriptional regulator [Mangrovimonas yunxiaonensis]KFB00155.1 cyclic nucleotide-binding protein [Mangrovimonas yunxiaonensis]MBR9757259.1 Crp/Fnr family transcriptional regulator [Algicola sp.]GGH42231.1 cyclic nucleotide-binding protein [Mangrovimonas yunxiaonensis]
MSLPNFKKHLIEKGGLSEDDYALIQPFIQTKTIPKTEFLLKQGAICSHFFFVEQGLLRMYALNEEGKENILQFATEGWIVSDRGSVFFQEPSTYYIDAVEDTLVVMLDEHFINEVSQVNAGFREKNEQLLQNHIRHLYKRISQLLGVSAKTRYLDFVSMHPDILLRVPQWMVASYLGITPESLSRVRKALADANFKPNH